MESENLKKNETIFTFFDLFFITLALLIGNIIHELDMGSVAKIFIVIVISAIIMFIDKANFRQKWKITKFGKINKYVFFGYILIAQFVLSIVIQF